MSMSPAAAEKVSNTPRSVADSVTLKSDNHLLAYAENDRHAMLEYHVWRTCSDGVRSCRTVGCHASW